MIEKAIIWYIKTLVDDYKSQILPTSIHNKDKIPSK